MSRSQPLVPSAFAKATRNVLNQWTALTRFLDDGRLRLDNNCTARQLRSVAVGRRNYLFAGSHDAARRSAVLYSLTHTYVQHHVPPLPYFTDVLRQLSNNVPRQHQQLTHKSGRGAHAGRNYYGQRGNEQMRTALTR